MRILLLCQGDPETLDSWSGSTYSLLHALRRDGYTVIPGNVEPGNLQRWRVAARAFSPSRRRWWVRFTLGRAGFQARSSLAAEHVRRHGADVDLILQIGATFRVPEGTPLPLALYCDANIEMAREGAQTGLSEASVLTAEEIEEIRAREAPVYRQADVIFTMSRYLARSFTTDFGIPPERLATVHTGANDEPGSIVRQSGTSDPEILFVGRDFRRKGGDVLLRAFREVRGSVPSARLTMVGPTASGIPRDLLQGLSGVSFPGYLSRATSHGRSAMDDAYRRAAIFCLPTRYEPFGTAFVEAMLYGLPCVGPRAWAVPEIIEPDQTGLLAEPGDDASFAEALVQLLSEPEGARAMGASGRQVALEQFTWRATVDRMTPHLRRLSVQRPEPGPGPQRNADPLRRRRSP